MHIRHGVAATYDKVLAAHPYPRTGKGGERHRDPRRFSEDINFFLPSESSGNAPGNCTCELSRAVIGSGRGTARGSRPLTPVSETLGFQLCFHYCWETLNVLSYFLTLGTSSVK